MNDDDVMRLNDAINGLNSLVASVNTYADVINTMASRQTAFAWAISSLGAKLEENGILSTVEISDEMVAAMQERFGKDDVRDSLVVFMFGKGEAPKQQPKLELIRGGKNTSEKED